MYLCPNCKNPVDDNMTICSNCGYSLGSRGDSPFTNNMPPYSSPAKPINNSFSIASMVLGIISIPLSCCCYIGAIPAILAIIFGFIARDQIAKSYGAQTGDGMALAGIITGFCTIGIIILLIILSINYNLNQKILDDFRDEFERSLENSHHSEI